MNIDERLANRNFLVDSNKYDNGGTIGRYIFNAGFVNSSIDNMVINSTGKKNGLPFLTALKNGGHYQNNAFFGGNFVLGEGLFDKVPGISMKNDSPTRFLSDKSIFGYKAQYYNAKSTETMFTDDMIKGIGGNKDFIIQSGVGFSKDYTKFFGALNRQGFNVTSVIEATENLPIGGVHDFKEYYKHGSKVSKENLAEYKKLIETKQNFKNDKKEIYKSKASSSNKKRKLKNLKKEIEESESKIDNLLKNDIKTKNIDFVNNPETTNIIKGDLKNHINNADVKDTLDLSEHMSFGKKSEQVRTAFGTTKYQNLKSVVKGEAGVEILTSKNKIDMYDDFFKNLDYIEQNLYNFKSNATTAEKLKIASKWVDDFKTGKIGETSEIGKFVKNSISKRGETVLKNGQEFIKNLKDGMVNDINKEFFQLSSLNKLFSNKYIQVATGNFVSGPVAIPLAVTTGIISAGANQHQEQSINNFRDMFSYDNTPVLDYYSEEALRTGYQHQQLSASNDQDIHYIKGNRNIASRYANDIAPVEIDRTATSLSSFTTI